MMSYCRVVISTLVPHYNGVEDMGGIVVYQQLSGKIEHFEYLEHILLLQNNKPFIIKSSYYELLSIV